MSLSPMVSTSAPVGRSFTMAELVALTGTAPSTIRYYIATGLVPPGRRLAANRFAYDERHVESLRLVRLLKERRRLPLEAIRRILPDLLRLPAGGAFRPEMWDVVVETRQKLVARSSPAARLLSAGIAAFDRRGYAEARVDDVCQAAGVAKGSFYRHFASKDELFFAAARAVADEAADRFAAAFEDPASPEGAVEVLAQALEPHLALLLDLLSLAAQRRPGHGRVLREVFTELHRCVRTRLDAMAAPERAEEVLERALIAGIRRVVVSPLLDAELFPGETGYSPG
ncbi:MAG: TetR family transcriptional regulator [Actinomycetota bacterium]|nr:TetR family transcriptional regulator [Actinomycetota bacterium]